MARVIKGSGGERPARQKPSGRAGGKRRVLEKEVYKAKQAAEQIKKKAEERAEEIRQAGKRTAAQLREEAQAEGAAEAFAVAAAEALTAFRRRAERYAEASDDIRVLALEVVRKIVGHPSRLTKPAIDAIVEQGMNRLRARRKLRLQLPYERLDALERERPALVGALNREPDLVLEAASDVSNGYCRVVTESGGALCSEQTALDTLADAIDVDEHAVAPQPRSTTHKVARSDVDGAPDDPEATHFLERAPKARGVGLGVTSPGAQIDGDSIQIDEARLRPLVEKGPDTDPEATQALDVADLRADLDNKAKADEEDDDDLDLFADDSLPER